MEKVLAVAEGLPFSKNLADFSEYIAGLTNLTITGIFQERKNGDLIPVMRKIQKVSLAQEAFGGALPQAHQCSNRCADPAGHSTKTCNKHNIVCTSDHSSGVPIEDVIKESRFVDLLIIDAEMSFDDNYVGVPSAFTKGVLTKSECPVVIAPYSFYDIDEIVFAYDGSPSAVFAIKQFTYLFKELTDKKLTIIQVNAQPGEEISERNKILALLQMHYSSIGFHVLTGNASTELYNYLSERKNAFVVMGAFGPQKLSLPFRRSTAEVLVKTVNLPLFISHHAL